MVGFSASAVESISFFQETICFMYVVYVGHFFSSNKRTHRSLKKFYCVQTVTTKLPPIFEFLITYVIVILYPTCFDIPDRVFYQTFWKIFYSGSRNCKSRTADNLNLLRFTVFC